MNWDIVGLMGECDRIFMVTKPRIVTSLSGGFKILLAVRSATDAT